MVSHACRPHAAQEPPLQCFLPLARGRCSGRAQRKRGAAPRMRPVRACRGGKRRSAMRRQPREQQPSGRVLPGAVGALCRALPSRARPAPDTLRRARFDRPQAVSAAPAVPPHPREHRDGTAGRGMSLWAAGIPVGGHCDRDSGVGSGGASAWAPRSGLSTLAALGRGLSYRGFNGKLRKSLNTFVVSPEVCRPVHQPGALQGGACEASSSCTGCSTCSLILSMV